MQVCNCRFHRNVLVLAQPQKLFSVLEKDLNTPAFVVHPDHLPGRHFRIIRDNVQHLFLPVFTRKDDMQWAQIADLNPAGIDIGVVGKTARFFNPAGFLRPTAE